MNFLLVHQTAGRTRLRAQLPAPDEVDWSAFAGAVAELSGVEAVDWRPGTGSLVIEHPEASWEQIAAGMQRLGARVLSAPRQPSAHRDTLAPVRGGVDQFNGLLNAVTAGGMDLRSLVFVILIGLALRQLWQGQVMAPAISLLWWAFDLVRTGAPQSGDGSDAGGD